MYHLVNHASHFSRGAKNHRTLWLFEIQFCPKVPHVCLIRLDEANLLSESFRHREHSIPHTVGDVGNFVAEALGDLQFNMRDLRYFSKAMQD
ncbi:hypothetical protein D3C84_820050 [compost metagenome]